RQAPCPLDAIQVVKFETTVIDGELLAESFEAECQLVVLVKLAAMANRAILFDDLLVAVQLHAGDQQPADTRRVHGHAILIPEYLGMIGPAAVGLLRAQVELLNLFPELVVDRDPRERGLAERQNGIL